MAYCQQLQRRGFEIALRCATMESSRRTRTVEGLEAFREQFGHNPALLTFELRHATDQLGWG